MPIISIRNLYKVFGPHPKRVFPLLEKGLSKQEILKRTKCTIAISGASFDIETGETFVVMGLSGSGKSTMIRCLNRLVKPTSGEISIDGSDIMKMDTEELRAVRRHKMSMVFQHFGLLPHRNVLHNVEFGLEISGVNKEERREKAMESIKLVGLEGFENSKTSELSGGMQQRVGLARALANDPEILLMDEAFSALDPLIRTQMQDELVDLQSKMHKTIVFITHDLDEALKLGDRILILGPDGRTHQIGTPEEILSNPADEYVEAFTESVDRTRIITAASVMRKHPSIVYPKDGPVAAVRAMEKNNVDSIFVIDSNRVLKGLVTIDDAVKLVKSKQKDLGPILRDNVYTTPDSTTISDLLGTVMQTKYPIAIINEENNVYLGAINKAAVIAELNQVADEDVAPTPLAEVMEFSSESADKGDT